MTEAQIREARAILAFMFAGNAIFTLRSVETGTRYTYKVVEAEKRNPNDPVTFFLKVLTGPDNTNDYVYVGIIRDNKFRTTAKSKMNAESGPVKAFVWALIQFQSGIMPAKLEFYHVGRCGRCGRVLTVPESVATGIGPDCAEQLGIQQVSLVVDPTAPTPAEVAQAKAIHTRLAENRRARIFGSKSVVIEPVSDAHIAKTLQNKQEVLDQVRVQAMVEHKKTTDPEGYYMDGELDDTTAFQFWTRRYTKQPLEGF